MKHCNSFVSALTSIPALAITEKPMKLPWFVYGFPRCVTGVEIIDVTAYAPKPNDASSQNENFQKFEPTLLSSCLVHGVDE